MELFFGSNVVDIFGDGATNRGPFLEGINWGSVFDLPILFVCEDNSYAATTKTSDVTGGDGPAARAEALGLRTTVIDGTFCRVLSWYDNEWGFSNRMGDVAAVLGGL